MIRDAARDDLPLIREILRRSNDAPYDIDAVAEEKCFGRGFCGEARVRLFDDTAVAVSCGRFLRLIAVDRDHRRRGIGTTLLRDAGATVIGAEPGNYFLPGVPESDAGFFLRRGYARTASTWNLHVDLDAGWDAGGLPGKVVVDEALLSFVRREFGGIWAFEVERAQVAFWIPDVGFAVIEANNRGLGTFGPTGVARQHRGQGHGRALLMAALGELARLGYRRAIIPWTDAVDFYRRSCGAKPVHRFLTLASC